MTSLVLDDRVPGGFRRAGGGVDREQTAASYVPVAGTLGARGAVAGTIAVQSQAATIADLQADLAFKSEGPGWTAREYVRLRYDVREFAWYWRELAPGVRPQVIDIHVAAGWEELPNEPPGLPGSWSYRAVKVYIVRRLRRGFEDVADPPGGWTLHPREEEGEDGREDTAAPLALVDDIREFNERLVQAAVDPAKTFEEAREVVERMRRDNEAEKVRLGAETVDALLSGMAALDSRDDAEVAAILAAPTPEAAWDRAMKAGAALAWQVSPRDTLKRFAHLSREVEAEESRVAAELLVRLAVAEVATSSYPLTGRMSTLDSESVAEKLDKARNVFAKREVRS